jgi:spore germination protein KB
MGVDIVERISLYQLAATIILFQVGSSPLFLLASEAKQDAWISVFIAMVCGLGLLTFITLEIQRLEPEKNLIEILTDYFGKIVGLILSWSYVIYFIYKSVRNVREFGDLTIEYLLPESPLQVICGILMLVSGYAVFKGVEVFFRVSEFLLPFIAFLYAALFLILMFAGVVQSNQLLPVLQEGIRPAVSAALPEVISFPFGEMVLFLMFWSYAKENRAMTKTTLKAYCLAGLFLVFTNAFIIAAIGPALAGAGGIPLMLAASLADISRVIERMDPFVAILLFTGVLIKQTAYYMGATLALASIFKTSPRRMLLPAGAAIYTGSMMFRSLMQHVWFGFEYNIKYHFPIFQIVLPILLLIVMKLRSKKQGSLIGGA